MEDSINLIPPRTTRPRRSYQHQLPLKLEHLHSKPTDKALLSSHPDVSTSATDRDAITGTNKTSRLSSVYRCDLTSRAYCLVDTRISHREEATSSYHRPLSSLPRIATRSEASSRWLLMSSEDDQDHLLELAIVLTTCTTWQALAGTTTSLD